MRLLPVAAAALAFAALISACDTVIDDRTPNYPAYIDLTGIGRWNIYGVSGYGVYRCFILTEKERIPANFPFLSTSATGYGGVLLIEGMDSFNPGLTMPLAYDMSCPYENRRDIRIYINDKLEAECPECHSRYDVTMGGGGPIGGPASAGDRKYGLKQYRCLGTPDDGYLITNR